MTPRNHAEIAWSAMPRAAKAVDGKAMAAVPTWFGALLIVALWLLARPYIGVRHDGVLYLGQTLLHLKPEALSQDIFFAYGSQDKYSVFSRLAAELYRSVGWAPTQMVVLAACHAGVLVATALLLRPLKSAFDRWLGLAALAVVSHGYGGLGIFGYAETFVTARTLAEPLALLATAALVAGRPQLALLSLALSALAHPLVALPAIVACWLLLCEQDSRWRWGLLLAVLPVMLGWVDFGPFGALFKTFDKEWGGLVAEVNGHVFVSLWGLIDWQVVAIDATLLALASVWLPAPLSRLCRAVLISATALLILGLVGADLFKNVLITGLQLWRGLWLVHLLATACLPALVLLLWRSREPAGRLAAAAVALAALAANAYWPSAWALLAWAALTVSLYARKQSLSPTISRTAMAATLVALAGVSVVSGVRNESSLAAAGAAMDAGMWLWVLFTTPALGIALAAASLWAINQGRALTLAAVVALAVAAAAAAMLWDRRPAWIEYIESIPPGTHPFTKYIPSQAQVYWQGELAATWTALARPSYFSTQQGAGLLFNRPTAMEFARRRPAFATLSFQQEICGIVSVLDPAAKKDDCVPDQVVIDEICRFPNGPDYLVLPYRTANGVIAEWSFNREPKPKTFFLYECLQLR